MRKTRRLAKSKSITARPPKLMQKTDANTDTNIGAKVCNNPKYVYGKYC